LEYHHDKVAAARCCADHGHACLSQDVLTFTDESGPGDVREVGNCVAGICKNIGTHCENGCAVIKRYAEVSAVYCRKSAFTCCELIKINTAACKVNK
jgi:hypothetical protein